MISRKKVLQTSAAAAVTLLAGQLSAGPKGKKKVSAVKNAIDSSQECIADAKICLTHCITEMGEGNKSLYACAKSVQAVIAGCEAFVGLASAGSAHAKKMADLCIQLCNECEKECAKHEKHHEECANCAESCRKCVAELKKI